MTYIFEFTSNNSSVAIKSPDQLVELLGRCMEKQVGAFEVTCTDTSHKSARWEAFIYKAFGLEPPTFSSAVSISFNETMACARFLSFGDEEWEPNMASSSLEIETFVTQAGESFTAPAQACVTRSLVRELVNQFYHTSRMPDVISWMKSTT